MFNMPVYELHPFLALQRIKILISLKHVIQTQNGFLVSSCHLYIKIFRKKKYESNIRGGLASKFIG